MTPRTTTSTSTEALQDGSTRLIEEIEEAAQNRDWATVHRLSRELLVFEGSLDVSLPSLENPVASRSDSDSGLYDRLTVTVLQAAPLVYFCKGVWQPWAPINFQWGKGRANQGFARRA
ncbi:hypothetical protein MHU86_20762 [Fragilaria crotonensis]|nr:hypothetical protein MHU86_20762 [Fragilaria crotonensis]